MKKSGLIIILFIIVALQNSLVFAQTGKKAEIRRIDAYCKTVDAFTKRYKNPHLIYADVSDNENNSKPKWRKFASEKALEKFRKTSETYSIAYNWRKNRRIVNTNFTLFSTSGDWSQYDYHYFRADGTIAKLASELRTFYGNIIVLHDFYFDGRGELLRKTIRYRDLNTEKSIKKPTDGYFENEITIYKTVKKLPFNKLVR